MKAYILPHPPIAVPEVGGDEIKKIDDTEKAFAKAAADIKREDPETIVIISPHADFYRDAFYIAKGSICTGDLARFGAPEPQVTYTYDTELSDEIVRLCDEFDIPTVYTGEDAAIMDHGAAVPLYYVNREYGTNNDAPYRIVRISPSLMSDDVLYDMGYLIEEYEKCTGMHVYERLPYAGALVFAAFSGSHQDAIAKGLNYREKNHLKKWNVPYIPIDPSDIGRTYDEDIIRFNSQSGKGGIGFILEKYFGYVLPSKMRGSFSRICKSVSDREHRELSPQEILDMFTERYLNLKGQIGITDYEFMRDGENVKIYISFIKDGTETAMEAEGNGSLSAISNALKAYTGKKYILQEFTQHSMQGHGSQSVAASYIGLESEDGNMYWGAGTDTDVIKASAKALLSAFTNFTDGRR